MISHDYQCTECKKVKEIDFANMSDRDDQEGTEIPCTKKNCKGKMLRYWGKGSAPFVNTNTSPARRGRGRW